MQSHQIKRGDQLQVPVLWPDYPPEPVTVLSRSPSTGEGWFRVRFDKSGGVLVVNASRMEKRK